MPRKPVIAVVGAGDAVQPAAPHANAVGKLIGQQGWVLITGGRNAGVMKAANDGAKEVSECPTIGILPDDKTEIASSVDVAIVTAAGEARNNIIVLSADVVIACGADDAGTASEVALALKNGKPVILLGASESACEFFCAIGAGCVHIADSPKGTIEIARRLLKG
jgi:uncharacterized protein (TIGR00725 family)